MGILGGVDCVHGLPKAAGSVTADNSSLYIKQSKTTLLVILCTTQLLATTSDNSCYQQPSEKTSWFFISSLACWGKWLYKSFTQFLHQLRFLFFCIFWRIELCNNHKFFISLSPLSIEILSSFKTHGEYCLFSSFHFALSPPGQALMALPRYLSAAV